MEEDSDDEIQCMELLDGNYQYYMQLGQLSNVWDESPRSFVKCAVVRFVVF